MSGLVLVGACSNQIAGTADADPSEVAAYVSEVAASSAAASSSRAAAVERAAATACDTFSDNNETAIDTFNIYIDASNDNAPDQEPKANAAVTQLRATASAVESKITRDVPASVADPLRAYRDDTMSLADALERRVDTDTLNAAIDKFNATKDTAVAACLAY
ncbi:MAG TPA: hypothetical protein VK083_06475 [Nocardia sp.]|uniref:hypothetical protein n=1 Tax=Nocardia sp. TaxID=1821 RepID=UPI002B4B5CD3|nr:hypothetical protein [Nocardia sp.]HLS76418.1 hypothetical protein [Nocardia sp.]